MSDTIHDFTVRRLDGTSESLGAYKGKVALIVNTASACGLTPQYAGLERLSKDLAAKGAVVLGFPSNDFGAQEPGTHEQIADFCQKNYGVTFPMFEKTKVKGEAASPLFKLLSSKAGEPMWNFHKYLVGKDGAVVAGFPSTLDPESPELRKAIDEALAR